MPQRKKSTDSASKPILVVDDEESIFYMVQRALNNEGMPCRHATDIYRAQSIILQQRPSLILLDWMLPGGSGIELLRELRQNNEMHHIPIIMLTVHDSEANIVQALNEGADDYICKPFSPREMISRILAVLRRTDSHSHQSLLVCGPLVLNHDNRQVTINEHPIKLTLTEFDLLWYLALHDERVLTRHQLLSEIWSGNYDIDERTVDANIRRLRRRLRSQPDCSGVVQTIYGVGYRFSKATIERSV